MPPWHMNTAQGKKLAEYFHHKRLLRFKYCVCLYLAPKHPTKDSVKIPRRDRVEGRAFISRADKR